MSNFFLSRIYHPDPKEKHHPTFALLSDQENFGIPEAVQAVLDKQVRYLMIIVNGQQIPSLEDGEENDKFFGRKLTGIHRVRENGRRGMLNWSYNIFNGQSPYPSTAATLYDTYRKQALILDVLDAKFGWEEPVADNEQSLANLLAAVRELLEAFKSSGQPGPAVFIAGYSRGGMLSLRLAEALRHLADVKAVMTIDPVIAPWKEDNRMVVGWGVKRGEIWDILWRAKLSGAHLYSDIFPILKNPGIPCYNVFQRRAFLALNNILEKPIGCAVENAKAPSPKARWELVPAGVEPHCGQYDLAMESHAAMVEKYAFWAIDLAKKYCPPET